MTVSNALLKLGLAGFLTIAPAAYSAAQESPDDAIESKIEATLKKDSILSARSIGVESEHGRVKLTGAVKTADEKARAEKLARIAGVTGVVNELRIDPNADRSKTDRAVEATKEGVDKAAQGVKKGVAESERAVGKAAGKTSEAIGTAGDKVTDESVSTRVKNGFSNDPLLKSARIKVETKARVVTLRGTVATDEMKTHAEEVAARTDGVTRVVNEIVVSKH